MLMRMNPFTRCSHGSTGLSRLRLHYIMEALCSQVMQEDWSLTTEVAAEKVMLLAPSEVRQLLYAKMPPRFGRVRSLPLNAFTRLRGDALLQPLGAQRA